MGDVVMVKYNITYESGEKLRNVLREIIQPENLVYDKYTDQDDNKNIYKVPGHENYLIYAYNQNTGQKVSCYAKELDDTGRLTYVSKFANGVLIPDSFDYVDDFDQLNVRAYSKHRETQELPDVFFDMDEESQRFTWEII